MGWFKERGYEWAGIFKEHGYERAGFSEAAARTMTVGEASAPPPQGDKSSFQAMEERMTARQRMTSRLSAVTSQVKTAAATSPRGRAILISLGQKIKKLYFF